MSDPVTYTEFCKRYGLDPEAKDSKEQYNDYKNKLSFFQELSRKNTDTVK